MSRRKFKRLAGHRITREEIERRSDYAVSRGYTKQKWLQFCETMLDTGLIVKVHEAASTFSKYVTVIDGASGRKFKVRFSNHKPNKRAENIGDSDFYVGVTNNRTTTTEQAIEAALEFYGKEMING